MASCEITEVDHEEEYFALKLFILQYTKDRLVKTPDLEPIEVVNIPITCLP